MHPIMIQKDSSFFISYKDIGNVVSSIHKLAIDTEKMSAGLMEGYRGYPWVIMSFSKSNDIKYIFNCWRWKVTQDNENNIINILFSGQKLGDDFIFFNAIAPYVLENSFIEMMEENGEKWRWSFTNKQCKKLKPKIIWE